MFEPCLARHGAMHVIASVGGIVSAILIAPCEAAADEGERTPYQLYEEGKRAYDAGDFGAAGKLLARADAVAPNHAVLDLAMAAARRADDPILGMELVERAERRGLGSSARDGRDVFASRVGTITVTCPESHRCDARVDGKVLDGPRSGWLRVGQHSVALDSDGNSERFTIFVEGDRTMVIRPTRVVEVATKATAEIVPAAPRARTSGEEAPSRPARGWFWGAVATTAAFGIATTVSGVDTLGTRSHFRSDPTNGDLADSGRSAETRTNVLLIGTLVAAVATTAVGYLVWRPHGR